MKIKAAPVLQALVLADHIYTDGDTGKRVICGTFSRIWTKSFPAVYAPKTWAFILLVEVVNEVVLRLRFVSLDEHNEILVESPEIRIRSEGPLVPIDIALQLPSLPLPRPGIYAFECYADGTMIGSVRLNVAELEENPNG